MLKITTIRSESSNSKENFATESNCSVVDYISLEKPIYDHEDVINEVVENIDDNDEREITHISRRHRE